MFLACNLLKFDVFFVVVVDAVVVRERERILLMNYLMLAK